MTREEWEQFLLIWKKLKEKYYTIKSITDLGDGVTMVEHIKNKNGNEI